MNMLEVEKKYYTNFLELFQELNWHLSSLVVLAGNNPGLVYADSATKPTFAFMISPEGCYLAGDTNNSDFIFKLKEYFENQFIPNWKQAEFEIIFLPKWETASKIIFESRPLIRYKRFHYTTILDKLETIGKFKNHVKFIQPDFVENNLNLKNMEYVKIWIKHNWGSYENFEKKGFGSYIVNEEKVLSWSVCDCIFQDRCEIGIWADEDIRRKGLATEVVKANLQLAFKKGFKEVGWHCSADNTGSYKTAEKAGFKSEREYFSYYGLKDKSKYRR